MGELLRTIVLTILAALLTSTLSLSSTLADASTPDIGQLGKPRPDLTPDELAAFNEGQKLFIQPLPYVGPFFNELACVNCHAIPTVGGSGDIDHAIFVGPAEGGDVEFYRKHAVPGFTIPPRPANVSRLLPPPLYGLALIERIPDATIRAACGQGHPDPAKLLGSTPVNTVARFGVKPFVGTVPDFIDGALLSESSVTSPIDKSKDEDSFPDPEVDRAFVDTLAAFVRGMAPPARNGTDKEGEAAFGAFGCAGCHVPDMLPARGVFSDFCVHGMGAALANGIFDHEAKGDEFRTTPLWGLRLRRFYLHDGRATSLDGAITAHAGEGERAANAYRNASNDERAALLRFLNTL